MKGHSSGQGMALSAEMLHVNKAKAMCQQKEMKSLGLFTRSLAWQEGRDSEELLAVTEGCCDMISLFLRCRLVQCRGWAGLERK